MATATQEKPATADSKETKERVKSQYIVLQVTDNAIEPIGEAEGLNDLQAIGEVCAARGLEEGNFVAVPQRSWRVRSVNVKVRRSVQVK